MSNFLSQFDNDKYQGDKSKPAVQKTETTRIEKKHTSKIPSSEHIVEVDTGHHKRKMARYLVIGGSVLAICLVTFLIFRIVNQVEVRNFVGTPINEARTWELSNRITIETDSEFNLEYEEGFIFAQEQEAGSNIQRGTVLRLSVSKGPDPDEQVELPDFEEMTTAEVRAWRQEVRALNININEEYSDEVEEGRFIRKEFINSSVTEETYTRQDGLLIYMSRGEQVFPQNIPVPNFTNQAKSEVEAWALEHEIDMTFAEEASDTIPIDIIISQNVEPGERIARRDEMTVTLSLGRSVTVPNFNSISMDDAGTYPGFEVHVQKRFHGNVAFGRLISQSEPAGTELIGEMPRVTVVYSLGRPYLDNLIGDSESGLPEYFHQFQSQGADITYTITYVDSSEPRGIIVRMSKYGQWLSLQEHIQIYVSKGNLAGSNIQSDSSVEEYSEDIE